MHEKSLGLSDQKIAANLELSKKDAATLILIKENTSHVRWRNDTSSSLENLARKLGSFCQGMQNIPYQNKMEAESRQFPIPMRFCIPPAF
jgi:hypothetical protein